MFVVNNGYSYGVTMVRSAYLSQAVCLKLFFCGKFGSRKAKINGRYYCKKACQYCYPPSALSKVIEGYCQDSWSKPKHIMLCY